MPGSHRDVGTGTPAFQSRSPALTRSPSTGGLPRPSTVLLQPPGGMLGKAASLTVGGRAAGAEEALIRSLSYRNRFDVGVDKYQAGRCTFYTRWP